MGRIVRVEVKDFKTYRGAQTIGPFRPFTAIMGPNGGGKSNLMDAISFVVGVQTKHLRGEQLRDLVYNADGQRDKTRREALVRLIYEPAAGELEGVKAGDEIEFARTINANGTCKYMLQGRTVTRDAYDKRLRDIGVLVRARNFLVFQGDVESIASKSPKQLTQFFEDISGSGALVSEYDELRTKKEEAETDTIFTYRQKKGITQERKQAREQKQEAERYNNKVRELDQLRTDFFLMQLWQIERGIGTHEARIKELESELAELLRQENVVERHIEDKRRQTAQAQRATADAERTVRRARTALTKTEPVSIKASETVAHLRRTLNADKGALERAEAEVENQANEHEGLAHDLERLEQAEQVLRKRLEEASMSSPLTPDQQRQLQEIKDQARTETVALRAQRESLRRGFDVRADRLASLERNIQVLEERKEQLGGEEVQLQARAERMTKAIGVLRGQVQTSQQALQEKTQEFENLMNLRQTRIQELDAASATLNQAKAYRQESQKERKMNEFLRALKSHFPGVRGRLVDLCRPSNRRFDVAISVALGRHMDAIVVDREETGLQCMKYMRDKRAGVATFLPLDTIEPKRTQERHRQLGAGYKLAIDVLEYSDDLEKAMQYALAGVVICDSLREARDLCFKRKERVKAVTIEGHIISTNGDMTGGTGHGARGGQQNRFEQRDLDAARERRNELRNELEDLEDRIVHIGGPQPGIAIGRNRGGRGPQGVTGPGARVGAPQEPSIQDIKLTVANAENKLKFAEVDLHTTNEKIQKLELTRRGVDQALASSVPERDELAAQTAQEKARLQQLDDQIQNVENDRVDDFGRRIQIANIRQAVREAETNQQSVATKLTQVTEQKTKLQSQLRYVESRKPEATLDRARKKVEQTEAALADHQRQAQKAAEELEKCNRELDEAEIAYKTQKRTADDKALESREAVTSRDGILMQKAQAMKRLTMQENEAEKLRARRHEMLHRAELEEVDIPRKGAAGSSTAAGRRRTVASSTSSSSSSANSSSTSDPAHSSDPSSYGFSQPDSKHVKRDELKTAKIDFSSLQDDPIWRTPEDGEGDDDDDDDNDGDGDGDGDENSEAETKAAREAKQKARAETRLTSARQAAMKRLDESIQALREELDKMQPNMKADERFADVSSRLKSTDEKLSRARQQSREVELSFEAVKQERYEKFMHMFEHVSSTIDKIYRELTKSSRHPLGGNAYLSLDNTDEPYLGGIKYNAMPPTKRFRDMDQLSGGEKTVAALALLFAIHSYHPAPFFVMDEVDAALDNVNVAKVSSYIRRNSSNFQCLVISLKDTFYDQADALVGVYREVRENCSKTLTLDMTLYPERVK